MSSSLILLFGGNGQIGQAFQHEPLPNGWTLKAVTRDQCDLSRPGDIAKIFRELSPDLVINAAAMCDIEACEKDPLIATTVNFHAVANIAGQCDTVNAPLIQISTDYVFDGKSGEKSYQTDDEMNPVNVYGQTKMMGEEAARHGLHWHVIARTSLVFSQYGKNVLTKALDQIDTQDEIQAVTDQWANPTSAQAVASGIITIGEAILKGKGNGFGTFHICGEPAVSRFEFLQAIMDNYAPYTARRPKLVPILAADMSNRIPRPPCSVLSNQRARDVYGIQPRLWQDDLKCAIRALRSS